MFQIKVVLPRYKKKVKSRKGDALRIGCTLVSFSKPSRAGWASSVSGHSAQPVFPLQPALQPLLHLLHWLRTTSTHSPTQPLWFCLCLFGLLSVIVYSKWDSQSIYHCHHVTAAKPPFSPQNRRFLAAVSLSGNAKFQVACCFSDFSGLCVGYEQKFQDRKSSNSSLS